MSAAIIEENIYQKNILTSLIDLSEKKQNKRFYSKKISFENTDSNYISFNFQDVQNPLEITEYVEKLSENDNTYFSDYLIQCNPVGINLFHPDSFDFGFPFYEKNYMYSPISVKKYSTDESIFPNIEKESDIDHYIYTVYKYDSSDLVKNTSLYLLIEQAEYMDSIIRKFKYNNRILVTMRHNRNFELNLPENPRIIDKETLLLSYKSDVSMRIYKTWTLLPTLYWDMNDVGLNILNKESESVAIDDDSEGTDTVWSSQKVSNAIQEAIGAAIGGSY